MSPITLPLPLAVDGYIRVSKVGGRAGPRFISPALQREQIGAWATARGAHVLEIFEELDASGARVDRPLLQEAIGRVEAGVSQGLVVAVLDRFGRSLVESLALIDRIQAAGGTFVAAHAIAGALRANYRNRASRWRPRPVMTAGRRPTQQRAGAAKRCARTAPLQRSRSIPLCSWSSSVLTRAA